MTPENELRKRKVLTNRCPYCDSSQIHFRKLIGNWKCRKKNCHKTFKTPKSDVKK